MILNERLKKLADNPKRDGDYLLFWVQASPRTHYNHALEYCIKMANKLEKPLLAFFGVTKFPEANERHYKFLLKGLKDLKSSLEDRRIPICAATMFTP
jgi:deoxyribodipyrimidine photo-lyase